MSNLCRRFEDNDAWDAWMESGLPPELEAHTRECEQCAPARKQFDALHKGFNAIVDESWELARGLDISDAVMSRLDEGSPSKRWAIVGAVTSFAAAAAMLLVANQPLTLEFDTNEHITLVSPAGEEQVTGQNLTSELPAALLVNAPVQFSLNDFWGRTAWGQLGPSARLDFPKSGPLRLAHGAVELSSDDDVALNTTHVSVTSVGHVALEIPREGNEMKLLNRYSVAAGAAVLVVAVYAGSATLRTPAGEITRHAPGGVAVGANGETRTFGLDEDDAGAVAELTKNAAGLQRGAEAGAPPESGSYWSEEEHTVMFALQGEVFDAVSGDPLRDFEIVAVPQKRVGFGTADHTKDFEGKTDGKFSLTGLGAGVWRVTARAEGYSPLTQTVDLSRVDADPFSSFGLFSGSRLSGEVKGPRGKPIEGAQVGLVECFSARTPAGCASAASDSRGRFVLDGVPVEESFTLRAEHGAYGFATLPDIKVNEGDSEHVVVTLSGKLRLFGTVTQGADKRPMAGARVMSADGDYFTVSNGAGEYEMIMPLESRPDVHVVAGSDRYEAKYASYPSMRSAEPIVWVDAKTHVAESHKDFLLAMESGVLFGRITDTEGNPLSGVAVHISNSAGWANRGHETFPERTVTAADGTYRLENVPVKAGYDLDYEGPNGDKRDLGYVNIMSDTPVEANFQLGGGTMRGNFVNGEGKPVSISERACRRLGAERLGDGFGYHRLARCLDGGRFEFKNIAPGEYLIHNRLEWMASTAELGEARVTVKEGQIVENVQIVAEEEPANTWKFRITDESGRFLTGVFTRYGVGNTSFTNSVNVDNSGVSTVDLSGAIETLFLDCPGYESAEVPVGSLDAGEVITLKMVRKPAK